MKRKRGSSKNGVKLPHLVTLFLIIISNTVSSPSKMICNHLVSKLVFVASRFLSNVFGGLASRFLPRQLGETSFFRELLGDLKQR